MEQIQEHREKPFEKIDNKIFEWDNEYDNPRFDNLSLRIFTYVCLDGFNTEYEYSKVTSLKQLAFHLGIGLKGIPRIKTSLIELTELVQLNTEQTQNLKFNEVKNLKPKDVFEITTPIPMDRFMMLDKSFLKFEYFKHKSIPAIYLQILFMDGVSKISKERVGDFRGVSMETSKRGFVSLQKLGLINYDKIYSKIGATTTWYVTDK